MFSFWALLLLVVGVVVELNTTAKVFSYIPYITVVPKLLEATGVLLFILTLASKVTKKKETKE